MSTNHFSVYCPRDVAMAIYVRETIASLMQSYPTATIWISSSFNLPDNDWLTDFNKPTPYKVKHPKSLDKQAALGLD